MVGRFDARGGRSRIHPFRCVPGSDLIYQRLDNAGGGMAIPELGDMSLLPFTPKDLSRFLDQTSAIQSD
jgi:hypothetical protein